MFFNWLARFLGLGPDPSNNCTPRVQRALVLARKAADNFSHQYVDTEHILLGILALGEGVGLGALLRQKIDLDRLKRDVESQMVPDPKYHSAETLPCRPNLLKIMRKYGADEARRLGHAHLGTEHILLGILRLETGIAYEALKKQSVEIAASRLAIVECLKPSTNESTAASQALPGYLGQSDKKP